MVVDQHRAHLNILFNQYMSRIEQNIQSSQALLFPEVLHLSNSQHIILTDILPEIEQMGFSLANLGGCDWSVNSIPVGFEKMKDVTETILQVIDAVEHGGDNIKKKVNENIALNVARASALPYGRTLTQEEMDKLISDLLRLSEPNYTPDGKKVLNVIEFDSISKLF